MSNSINDPINRESFELALEFTNNFYNSISLLQFGAEPNGDVSIEWDNKSTDATFCISFTDDNKIHYAGIDAYDVKINGTVKYTGGSIPSIITEQLTRAFCLMYR